MTELSLVVRATVILVMGFALLRMCRRRSAALRALLLTLAFGMLLALPIAGAILPTWRIANPLPRAASAAVPRMLGRVAPAPVTMAIVARPSTPAPPTSITWSPVSIVAFIWGVGVVGAAIPVLLVVRRSSRVRRRGTPWPHGEAVARSILERRRPIRPVTVVLDNDALVPFACGVRAATIVFPRDAQRWSDDDLRRALVHELEHIQRGDWLVLLGSRLVCTMYWFHPLVWLAWRRLRLEIEHACDDAVLRVSEASTYAEQLVGLASRLSARTPVPLLSMASRSDLASRVASMIDSAQRRTPPRQRARLTTTAAAVVLLVVTASTQIASMPASRQARHDPLTKLAVPDESEITHTGVGETATVFGYLFDPLGAPLEGVVLALERGRFFDTSTTDQTGRYEFRKLQPGLYSFYAPTVEMIEPLTLRLAAGDEVDHDVHMTITSLVGSFTVCAECVMRTESYEPPDSLANEIEQDRREWAQKQVVTGPEPVGGWESLHATIPEYPEFLARKNLAGSVVVEGVIGTDGFRTKMRVVSAAHPDLAIAALELLRNEQWQPARVRGLAFEVPFREQIEFVLRLPER